MDSLDGKTAIITGAASGKGMGFATARIMAARGVRLLLTDLDGAAVRARASELCGAVQAMQHDVTSESDWTNVVAAAMRSFGGVNILVNNAGVSIGGPIQKFSRQAWDAQMAVNLTGPFLGCRAAVPAIRASGGGAIVNVSSIAGINGASGFSGYSASKAGVRLLTESLALELAGDNIRVNSVHPGVVETDMAAGPGRAALPQTVANDRDHPRWKSRSFSSRNPLPGSAGMRGLGGGRKRSPRM